LTGARQTAAGPRPGPGRRTAVEARIRDNPVAGDAPAMRQAFARLAGKQPALPRHRIGGVACRVTGDGNRPILWLHGGGYVFGGHDSHAAAAAFLAGLLPEARTILPAYARAPEQTWPAPLNDALAVVDALDGPVDIVGDSAGGHLGLQVAFARPDRVRALALISPNTDRTGRNTRRKANTATDLMNDDGQDAALARMAMPGIAPDDPVASPLAGPLDMLPPLYVTYSENEVLADDARLLAGAARAAGVPVTVRPREGLFHMWTLWPEEIPEAHDTLAEIAGFLSARWSRAEPEPKPAAIG
jgi:acetyl esterase/lipase